MFGSSFFVGVHLTDQLSNFRTIPDYLKVADFIEEKRIVNLIREK